MNKEQVYSALEENRPNKNGSLLLFSEFECQDNGVFFFPNFIDDSLLTHEEINIYINLLKNAKKMLPESQIEVFNEENKQQSKQGIQPQFDDGLRKKNHGYVYMMRSSNDKYKIGMSKDPSKRIKSIRGNTPFGIECVHIIETKDMRGLESHMHRKFKENVIAGEWFNLTMDQVHYFKNYKEA